MDFSLVVSPDAVSRLMQLSPAILLAKLKFSVLGAHNLFPQHCYKSIAIERNHEHLKAESTDWDGRKQVMQFPDSLVLAEELRLNGMATTELNPMPLGGYTKLTATYWGSWMVNALHEELDEVVLAVNPLVPNHDSFMAVLEPLKSVRRIEIRWGTFADADTYFTTLQTWLRKGKRKLDHLHIAVDQLPSAMELSALSCIIEHFKVKVCLELLSLPSRRKSVTELFRALFKADSQPIHIPQCRLHGDLPINATVSVTTYSANGKQTTKLFHFGCAAAFISGTFFLAKVVWHL